jgi:hypothetical protein
MRIEKEKKEQEIYEAMLEQDKQERVAYEAM